MDGLHTMDKQDYLEQMQADVQRVLARVADAVNGAASGNVINGSEMEVLAAMTELKELAFQKAVQMRVDSTESTFFPGGPVGAAEAEQRADGVDDEIKLFSSFGVSAFAFVRCFVRTLFAEGSRT